MHEMNDRSYLLIIQNQYFRYKNRIFDQSAGILLGKARGLPDGLTCKDNQAVIFYLLLHLILQRHF